MPEQIHSTTTILVDYKNNNAIEAHRRKCVVIIRSDGKLIIKQYSTKQVDNGALSGEDVHYMFRVKESEQNEFCEKIRTLLQTNPSPKNFKSAVHCFLKECAFYKEFTNYQELTKFADSHYDSTERRTQTLMEEAVKNYSELKNRTERLNVLFKENGVKTDELNGLVEQLRKKIEEITAQFQKYNISSIQEDKSRFVFDSESLQVLEKDYYQKEREWVALLFAALERSLNVAFKKLQDIYQNTPLIHDIALEYQNRLQTFNKNSLPALSQHIKNCQGEEGRISLESINQLVREAKELNEKIEDCGTKIQWESEKVVQDSIKKQHGSCQNKPDLVQKSLEKDLMNSASDDPSREEEPRITSELCPLEGLFLNTEMNKVIDDIRSHAKKLAVFTKGLAHQKSVVLSEVISRWEKSLPPEEIRAYISKNMGLLSTYRGSSCFRFFARSWGGGIVTSKKLIDRFETLLDQGNEAEVTSGVDLLSIR